MLSDKQTGLVPAVATALPNSRHQLCQAHYLRNLAEPLAAADAAFTGELRKTVRQHVGALLRQEARKPPDHTGVLTMTGLLPSPVEESTAPSCQSLLPAASPSAPDPGRIRSSPCSCATCVTCSHSKAGRPFVWQVWRPTNDSAASGVSLDLLATQL